MADTPSDNPEVEVLIGFEKLRTTLQYLVRQVKTNAAAIKASASTVHAQQVAMLTTQVQALEERATQAHDDLAAKMEKSDVVTMIANKETSILKKQSGIFRNLTERLDAVDNFVTEQKAKGQEWDSKLQVINDFNTITTKEKWDTQNQRDELMDGQIVELQNKVQLLQEENEKKDIMIHDILEKIGMLEVLIRQRPTTVIVHQAAPPPPPPPKTAESKHEHESEASNDEVSKTDFDEETKKANEFDAETENDKIAVRKPIKREKMKSREKRRQSELFSDDFGSVASSTRANTPISEGLMDSDVQRINEEIQELHENLEAIQQKQEEAPTHADVDRVVKLVTKSQQRMTEMEARLESLQSLESLSSDDNTSNPISNFLFSHISALISRDAGFKKINKELARLKFLTAAMQTDVSALKARSRHSPVVQYSSGGGGGGDFNGADVLQSRIDSLQDLIGNLESQFTIKIPEIGNSLEEIAQTSIPGINAAIMTLQKDSKFHAALLTKQGEKIEQNEVIVQDIDEKLEAVSKNKVTDLLTTIKSSPNRAVNNNEEFSPRDSDNTSPKNRRTAVTRFGGSLPIDGDTGTTSLIKEHTRKLEAAQLLLSMFKDRLGRKAEKRDFELVKQGMSTIFEAIKKVAELTSADKPTLDDIFQNLHSRLSVLEATADKLTGKKGEGTAKSDGTEKNASNLPNSGLPLDAAGVILQIQHLQESQTILIQRLALVNDTLVAFKRQVLSLLHQKANKTDVSQLSDKLQQGALRLTGAVEPYLITSMNAEPMPSFIAQSLKYKCLSCERQFKAKAEKPKKKTVLPEVPTRSGSQTHRGRLEMVDSTNSNNINNNNNNGNEEHVEEQTTMSDWEGNIMVQAIPVPPETERVRSSGRGFRVTQLQPDIFDN